MYVFCFAGPSRTAKHISLCAKESFIASTLTRHTKCFCFATIDTDVYPEATDVLGSRLLRAPSSRFWICLEDLFQNNRVFP